MPIIRIKYASEDKSSITVTTDQSEYSAPWPCYTWHAQEIQEALDAGLSIEPYKTYSELENEKKSIRKQEIISALNDIDAQSVRPLRSRVNGTATSFDEEKLISLEHQASELRSEILSL